jgi:methionyl-tRNA synthetase
LHVVLTLALNYFRLLTIWLAPAVPATAARAFAFLGDTPTRFTAARQPLRGLPAQALRRQAGRHVG